ncbi:hypothetical protein H5410_033399 [Solanum commersonii]|uniref:Isopenicillin N synthase-like Fe(2+) 2OG dioxygenase domain-containing protein n=1 Tax=Solanum commersonii TaxID=4109 RepID=A0A9J5YQ16_SOLCO|nr:hypothetical protein H5410_033399 [Solanum commersonii]
MNCENIKLPKIDFSHEDLKPDTLIWNQVKSQVHKAIVEYGCFEAFFNKIPIHLKKSIFEFSQEIFDLPLQTKLKNISTNFMAMWDNTILFHSLKAWALMILTSLIKLKNSLKFYGPRKSFYLARKFLQYYTKVNGLQLLTKDGQWKNINPTPGTFTIIIGDSLHVWTNGRMHAPYHRVLIRGNETRYSVGLFSTPKDGYTIKTPKELIDEDHPLLFKPHNHFEFLNFSYTKKACNVNLL